MILGTRTSALARRQTGWVRDRLAALHPGEKFTVELIRTTGDRRQSLPAEPLPGGVKAASSKGIFVKEIEEALLRRAIDAAVHSLKDLPIEQPEGLAVVGIPAREDARDVLVSPGGGDIDELPVGSTIGTASPRRAAQLRAHRPDLVLRPIRGNVDTRIRKMLSGYTDAVVLAAAGLARLGMRGSTLAGGREFGCHPISVDICLPAVGQGALAIECRAADARTRAIVMAIHDAQAAAEASAERAFLRALGGGCRVPVAALARLGDAEGQRLALRGLVASTDGSRLVRVAGESSASAAEALGIDLARRAFERGAADILESNR